MHSLHLSLSLSLSQNSFVCHLNKLNSNENGKIVFFATIFLFSIIVLKMASLSLRGFFECNRLQLRFEWMGVKNCAEKIFVDRKKRVFSSSDFCEWEKNAVKLEIKLKTWFCTLIEHFECCLWNNYEKCDCGKHARWFAGWQRNEQINKSEWIEMIEKQIVDG